MNTTRTINHDSNHTDIETYMQDVDGVWMWAVTQCNGGAMTDKMTTREYLERLAQKGYTVISPDVMTVQDVLVLYEQLDSLRDSLRDANEGAKLLHSLATNGEQSVLSRLDNGVDVQDVERWKDERPTAREIALPNGQLRSYASYNNSGKGKPLPAEEVDGEQLGM